MKVYHRINGKDYGATFFRSKSPFNQVNYEIEIPNLSTSEINMAKDALDNTHIPSIGQRLSVLKSLNDFSLSYSGLEGVCYLTGTPIRQVEELINQGKDLVQGFKYLEPRSEDKNRKTVFVAIPFNDPREVFYFIGHCLVAGTPSILKPSRREPILTGEIVSFMEKRGLPSGFFSVLHGDTTSQLESKLIMEAMSSTNLPIVMGDSKLCKNQLSFNADHSKAIVVDPELALRTAKQSILAPLSCLSIHNYLVLGDEAFNYFVQGLKGIYSNLQRGLLTDRNTDLGLIEEPVLDSLRTLLNQGIIYDSLKLLYPETIRSQDSLLGGVLIEHFSEDESVGANPFLTSPLPAYITAVRNVSSLEQAFHDLHFATQKLPGRKCMALATFGLSNEQILYYYYKDNRTIDSTKTIFDDPCTIPDITYDLYINKDPMNVKGIKHQGIRLNTELTQ